MRQIFIGVQSSLSSLKFKLLSVNLVLAPTPEILEGQAWETTVGNLCVFTHTHGIKKNGADEPICRAGIETQT